MYTALRLVWALNHRFECLKLLPPKTFIEMSSLLIRYSFLAYEDDYDYDLDAHSANFLVMQLWIQFCLNVTLNSIRWLLKSTTMLTYLHFSLYYICNQLMLSINRNLDYKPLALKHWDFKTAGVDALLGYEFTNIMSWFCFRELAHCILTEVNIKWSWFHHVLFIAKSWWLAQDRPKF